jgi:enoyl-CoA hydratase/carnithine racemase
MSEDQPVLTIDSPSNGVTRIGLNRPEKRNALNPELRLGLIDALDRAVQDDEVRAIIIAGNGGHFCAGGDIASMSGLDAAAGRARMKSNHRMVRLIAQSEKPVIAAVEGFAMGAGAGIALLADTIVMAETATMGFPFFKVGLIPDYGILHTLPRRVGAAKARQILLYASMLKGPAVVDAGLADDLAPEGQTEALALERAQALAAMPPYAYALAKQQLGLAPVSLDAALEMEALGQASTFTTGEFAEGRAAFQEKRAPDFRR